MKKFMETCYKCGSEVEEAEVEKDSVLLKCLKCPECGEEYFTSSELKKYEARKGDKNMRKFGTLGDSTIVRIPPKILQELEIEPGDYGIVEEEKGSIKIKPYKATEVKS